jgi:hypothetical protein
MLARACAIAASSERAMSTRGNRSSNEAGGSRPMLLKRMTTEGRREETRGRRVRAEQEREGEVHRA